MPLVNTYDLPTRERDLDEAKMLTFGVDAALMALRGEGGNRTLIVDFVIGYVRLLRDLLGIDSEVDV